MVFDLDGTLIQQPNDVPGEKLKGLLNRLRNDRVKVTLATGRTFAGASRVVGSVESLGKIPLVVYNGSVVMDAHEKVVISRTTIGLGAADQATKMAVAAGAEALLYCVREDATDGNGVEYVYHFGIEPAPAVEFTGMQVRTGWQPSDSEAPVAILISAATPSTLAELRESLVHVAGISVTKSGNKYLEIRPAGSSKESGLEKLVSVLKIDRAHVLAVGDNDNDVELLKWAGISVCVAGASAAAMAASRYVANYGAELGAIEVLDLIRRAQRLAKGGKIRGNSQRQHKSTSGKA